jgi:hypothetical protein
MNLQPWLEHWTRTSVPAVALSTLVLAIGVPAWAAETNPDLAGTNSASAITFQSFRLISERNIFEPQRRRTHLPPQPPTVPTPPVDSFALLGTMSSAQGTFAFFGGTSAQFRRTAKPGDRIANYRIAEIRHGSVKLVTTSNQAIDLQVQAGILTSQEQ